MVCTFIEMQIISWSFIFLLMNAYNILDLHLSSYSSNACGEGEGPLNPPVSWM